MRTSQSIISLKPQDIVILLKILVLRDNDWTQALLAKSLKMPVGYLNQALKRISDCNLYDQKRKLVYTEALKSFLLHGIRFAFPVVRGSMARGMPTGSAGPPLNKIMDTEALKWPPVWPDIQGTEQGYAIIPLHPEVPNIAREDEHLYELLALVDALREGRPRERNLAAQELSKRIDEYRAHKAK